MTDEKEREAIGRPLADLLNVAPDERFVAGVMARIEVLPVPGWRGWLRRLEERIPGWLYPELGMAVAAFLVFLAAAFQPIPVSADILLVDRLERSPAPAEGLLPATGTEEELLWWTE
ncbi:MAG: hypothetical protein COV76_04510 [Candidatus Omnitrophica bacterium CG11_big_fil_rev_8_21_14_0_20_64_10]|nr:MAG: hypothetical protein COV76_04510 [Candidatus Omnitrophica bacterium CG11_big_fil_rev_8_21_14_0_20_64_10]